MTKSDADLEFKIDMAALRLQCALTPEARQRAWAELKSLSKQRSSGRVAEMERQWELLH